MTVIDWFIPSRLKRDIAAYSTARIIVGVTLLFSLLLFPNSIRGILHENYIATAAIVMVTLLSIAGLFILKKTGSNLSAGNFMMFLYFSLMAIIIFEGGGVKSTLTLNLLPIVLLSFLFCGRISGIVWSVLAAGYLISLRMMEMSGYQFAAVNPEGLESGAVLINILVIIFMICTLGIVYETTSKGNLRKFAAQREKSDKMAEDIQKVLRKTDTVMRAMSQGDLSQKFDIEIPGEFQGLKEGINRSLLLFSNTLTQIKSGISGVGGMTTEIAQSMQALAEGTTKQASALEQVSSSMGVIGAKSQTNSEDAEKARELSLKAVESAKSGENQMEEMLASMKLMNDTSTDISGVIKVIDEIAFQTKLLALNAAVEAARAGKYGKGFAVVAEEVRNLAARSANAAKNTAELIESAIQEVRTSVQKTGQTTDLLKGFVSDIDHVHHIIADISNASIDQGKGVNEINSAMNHINDVGQSYSAISEETASASEQLLSQVKQLNSFISHFKFADTQNQDQVTVAENPYPAKNTTVCLPSEQDYYDREFSFTRN